MLKPLIDFVGGLFGIADVERIPDGYATFVTYLIAIFVGVLAFLASYYRHKIEHRNENSANYLSSTNQAVIEGMAELQPLVGRSLSLEQKREFIQTHARQYFAVVAHFEMVAVYISIGLASERIVKRIEAGNIMRLFSSIAPLLPEQRARNAKVLIYYESLFIRFFFGARSVLAFCIFLVTWDRMMASRQAFLLYHSLYATWTGASRQYLTVDFMQVRGSLCRFKLLRYAMLTFGVLLAVMVFSKH